MLHNTSETVWSGALNDIATDADGIRACLLDLERPCYLLDVQGRIGASNSGSMSHGPGDVALLATTPALGPTRLGSALFRAFHRARYAYMAGAMAHGIASTTLVTALGQQGILASFGAAGLTLDQIEAAAAQIGRALPDGPAACNLIHHPGEPGLEQQIVDRYQKHGIRTIEASAFVTLTPALVAYRAAGLSVNSQGQIISQHRLIAKVSRREVAAQFLQPPPAAMLQQLVMRGQISEQQANLAATLPVADDLTIEADSAGHTDNRPLVCLLPAMLALRDSLQEQYGYPQVVRVGAGGGIGTPAAALAAFMLGAEYIVTGSINQACIEAGTSPQVRQLLAQADMVDVIMAPAADTFESGGRVQLLKKGILFPMRAQKLYDLYRSYDSLEALPAEERRQLEQQILRRSVEEVWADTCTYFAERDPEQITRALADPRRKMALVFRWYLGMSSRWANSGQPGRELDYQIWCGPAMGAFNGWVRGSYLEAPDRRTAGDIAYHLMTGAAFLYRLQHIQLQGVTIPSYYRRYLPQPISPLAPW